VVGTSRSIQTSNDPNFLTVAGDIGDPATARKVVDLALTRFGRIDTLVNNAGIFIASEFTAYTQQQYEEVLATDVAGFYHMTQQVVPAMLEQVVATSCRSPARWSTMRTRRCRRCSHR